MPRVREVFQGRRGLALIAVGCSLVWLVLPGVLALAGYARAALAALLLYVIVPPALVLIVVFLRVFFRALARASVRAITPEGWNELEAHTRRQLQEAVMAGRASPRADLADIAADRARRMRRSKMTTIATDVLLAVLFLFNAASGSHVWPDLIVGLGMAIAAAGHLRVAARLRRAERLNRNLSRDRQPFSQPDRPG